jgi:hypothetical protein
MAVLGSKHVGGWGKKDLAEGEFGFYIKKKDYDKAKEEGWHGYVYILKREGFNPYMAWEWRAHGPIRPLKCIPVSLSDLPKNVELEED